MSRHTASLSGLSLPRVTRVTTVINTDGRNYRLNGYVTTAYRQHHRVMLARQLEKHAVRQQSRVMGGERRMLQEAVMLRLRHYADNTAAV